MNGALWVGQGLLALVFMASGGAKSVLPKDRLMASGQTGVRDYSPGTTRVIAGCELAAVVGLTVPWAMGMARVLTPLAALGLAAVMIGAARAHTRLRELRNVAINAVLFAVCVWVAAARFRDL